uniref:Uncharacterized protein n=1 Tax=Rhizophora mucronata TaxID=61149 RepID=A0A2P2QN05_RHIMU
MMTMKKHLKIQDYREK